MSGVGGTVLEINNWLGLYSGRYGIVIIIIIIDISASKPNFINHDG